MKMSALNRVHAHSTWFYGLLPPTLNIISLVVASAAIASGFWLWGWATTYLAFMPAGLEAMGGVIGAAAYLFWFNKEIQTVLLDIKPAEEDSRHGRAAELDDMYKLATKIVNLHYGADNDTKLRMGRCGVFESDKPAYKFVDVPGRNGANSVCAISQSVFDDDSKMTNELVMAWLLKAQVKAYHNRGWTHFFINMFEALSSTLTNLQDAESTLGKMVWLAASPLQLFLLLPKLIKRAHEYEAWREVVKMGYGYEAIEFLEVKSNRNRTQRPKPWNVIISKIKREKKRKPYDGPLKGLVRPFANLLDSFLDKNEWAKDYKHDNRLFSVINIIFLNVGRWVKELFSDVPNGFNTKEVLKDDLPGYRETHAELKTDLEAALAIEDTVQQEQAKQAAIQKYQDKMAELKQAERVRQEQDLPSDNSEKAQKVKARFNLFFGANAFTPARDAQAANDAAPAASEQVPRDSASPRQRAS